MLDSLALHLAVLDWPQDTATHYAEIRADLKKRGAQLGAADLMIAGETTEGVSDVAIYLSMIYMIF